LRTEQRKDSTPPVWPPESVGYNQRDNTRRPSLALAVSLLRFTVYVKRLEKEIRRRIVCCITHTCQTVHGSKCCLTCKGLFHYCPLMMGNELARNCTHKLAGPHSMDTLKLAFQRDGKDAFGTCAAVQLDISGTPNAHACCCQGRCYRDEYHLQHCAHSPIQAAAHVALLQTWAALFAF